MKRQTIKDRMCEHAGMETYERGPIKIEKKRVEKSKSMPKSKKDKNGKKKK